MNQPDWFQEWRNEAKQVDELRHALWDIRLLMAKGLALDEIDKRAREALGVAE